MSRPNRSGCLLRGWQRPCLAAVCAVFAWPLAPVSGQDVLWDNGQWDGSSNISSERNTVVTESWAVDDVSFVSDVEIRRYRWTAILLDGWGGSGPTGVDFVVLSSELEKFVELRDLTYTMERIGEVFGNPYFRFEVDALDVGLPAGRYYIGARPVGRGQYQAFACLNQGLLGNTEAYWRSPWFGFPDWVSVAQIIGVRRDIAFTVFGHVVREEVRAESFTVPLGRHLSGEVADLHESDDLYVTIRNRALMALTLPMIRMEVQGTTAVETASRITVTVETAASNMPNQPLQRLALFDYIAERWITIDERATTIIDTSIEVIIEDDPTRFIAPGTGQLKMRLDWFDPGATTPWGVRIDQATWVVER